MSLLFTLKFKKSIVLIQIIFIDTLSPLMLKNLSLSLTKHLLTILMYLWSYPYLMFYQCQPLRNQVPYSILFPQSKRLSLKNGIVVIHMIFIDTLSPLMLHFFSLNLTIHLLTILMYVSSYPYLMFYQCQPLRNLRLLLHLQL